MKADTRTSQLQIRVTPAQKAAIARAARRAGLGMSAYVLVRALPNQAARWSEHVRHLARGDSARTALAALSAWIAGLGSAEIAGALAEAPTGLSEFHANYVAAMVEHACAANGIDPPPWTRDIPPVERPVFATELASLRLHLLTHSPPAFRRRNLFVDTAVGGQV